MATTTAPPGNAQAAKQPPTYSKAGTNLERIVHEQGRSIVWVAKQLGISRTYLYRMRLDPTHPYSCPPSPGLWQKCARLLGVKDKAITG